MSKQPSVRQRVYEFLERHPDRVYTEKQIAHYLGLPASVVLGQLRVLVRQGVVVEEDL